MPGRYSHSVVLAGYSNQGIIDLPKEQHVEYSRTSPYATLSHQQKSGPSRLSQHDPYRRSQSAMTTRSGRRTPVAPGMRYPLERVFIDSDDFVPTRSKSQQQSQPTTINLRPHHKSITQQTLPIKLPVELQSRSASRLSVVSQPPIQSIPREKQHETSFNSQPHTPQPLRSHPPDLQNSSSRFPQQIPYDTHGKVQNYQSKTLAISTIITQPQRSIDNPPSIQRQNSATTVRTQIYTRGPGLEEPNFDDFSDENESQTSYFESHSSTARIAPDSDVHIPQQERESGAVSTVKNTPRPIKINHSHTSPSSTESDRNNTAFSDESARNLHSRSSASSTGSVTTQSLHRATKATEAKKPRAPSPISQWGLPEIDEDATFSPEAFVQGLDDDVVRLGAASPRFGESSFGMISSGRDVTFESDDDTESDAASACPPDIGRYRDEEETAPPNFLSRTKIEDDRVPSPTLASTKSKKGLLARLKARRSWV